MQRAMIFRLLATAGLVALDASYGSVRAQQQPYAGMESRTIKTLSDQQIADLKEGNGMGLALAGELNGGRSASPTAAARVPAAAT